MHLPGNRAQPFDTFLSQVRKKAFCPSVRCETERGAGIIGCVLPVETGGGIISPPRSGACVCCLFSGALLFSEGKSCVCFSSASSQNSDDDARWRNVKTWETRVRVRDGMGKNPTISKLNAKIIRRKTYLFISFLIILRFYIFYHLYFYFIILI